MCVCVSEWRNGQHFIGGLWIITASLEPHTSEMELQGVEEGGGQGWEQEGSE